MRYGLFLNAETQDQAKERTGDNVPHVDAATVDEALAQFVKAVPKANTVKLSDTNAATHVKHRPDIRRFSVTTAKGSTAFRVAALRVKAEPKASLARQLQVRDAAIATLAKRLKLTDASIAALLADCEKSLA